MPIHSLFCKLCAAKNIHLKCDTILKSVLLKINNNILIVLYKFNILCRTDYIKLSVVHNLRMSERKEFATV